MKSIKRLWQIDAARGLAILGMVVYHFLFDLNFFLGTNLPVFDPPLLFLARATAILFIFLVGVSASLNFRSHTHTSVAIFFKRSMVILFWAAAITLTTYIFFPREFIIFGVLHLIGLSLLLLIPFLFVANDRFLLISGLIIITTGFIISRGSTDSYALVWLGLKPRQFISLDYLPLIPWFGVVLLGLLFGRHYSPTVTKNKFPFLSSLGRHSLTIYLLHQPLILTLLYLGKNIVD